MECLLLVISLTSSQDGELGQGFYWSLADLTQAWVDCLRVTCLGRNEEINTITVLLDFTVWKEYQILWSRPCI
ncbi:hypothetical protein OS493_015985 [Desmophyllum pertusum]|uniref:Uncharacterized protein n=1 Tax=Desmophyllum pertusum TaxID=174260 RepID=A0A9W9YGA0_9CNID|nr:hypothetical protein OS493_015985 [Desmophyllum pertusum]